MLLPGVAGFFITLCCCGKKQLIPRMKVNLGSRFEAMACHGLEGMAREHEAHSQEAER